MLAVDVDYKNNIAHIAGVAFSDWQDTAPVAIYTSSMTNIADYEPGAFFRRELPCILKLLREHKLAPDCIVIDGFVYLDGQEKPGLGKHLHDALSGQTKVIGVAKRPFVNIPASCEIFRGQSLRPLYITAAGLSLELAKRSVSIMHGKYRLPDLLRKADQVCRQRDVGNDHHGSDESGGIESDLQK